MTLYPDISKQRAHHPFWLGVDVPQTAYLEVACKVVLECNLQNPEVLGTPQASQISQGQRGAAGISDAGPH